ncbi:hypothetical protein ADUPG1_012396 [Aduncisulcus paluster]|uniref:Protein kinase domain-containing protein n=1 Tax=Aduncisulcus paluster TaxID=2918883 RepID=A0ABQ5JZB8_9EUKA|nr:hypothetical protein ADUPG1_012396 [Aduncisulcus paluster]
MDLNPSSESEIQLVYPEFIREGGLSCLPIPCDAPNITNPDFDNINSINETVDIGQDGYELSSEVQEMMKGETEFISGSCTYISIPLSASTPLKGSYICIVKNLAPFHLIFTFTSPTGLKTHKKYKFSKTESTLSEREKDTSESSKEDSESESSEDGSESIDSVFEYEWYFLPIDLDDVISCEIEGKGWDDDDNNRSFWIDALVFFREETLEERCIRESIEDQWSKAPAIKSEFVNSGDASAIPIPRDDPAVNSPSFEMVKGKNDLYSIESEYYDQSEGAQEMLKGEGEVILSHLSIPFPSPSPMKGAYICVDKDSSSPSLLFTFTDSDGKKIYKKYKFIRPKYDYEWHFLPIDLENIVLCEIEGKGWDDDDNNRSFWIDALVFFREETLEERCIRESIEDQWSKAPAIKSEFVNSGDASAIPIPRDDPAVNSPSFEMVKGKNDLYSIESEYYDQSEGAQEMLKGEGEVILSHLSIPFPSPSPMKGAYICVDKDSSSPSLLFTFTDSDGKKIYKKYKFIRPKYDYEWHFLPIDLENIVLCDIKGKGMWEEKNSRYFDVESLVFFREETSEESTNRKQRIESLKKIWGKTPIIPQYINSGYRFSIPISCDNPCVINSSLSMVKSKDDSKSKESEDYDQGSNAQKMLKGEGEVTLSHLSIPFPSPCRMKGAYICVDGYHSSPSLLYTFILSNNTKTFKRYLFSDEKKQKKNSESESTLLEREKDTSESSKEDSESESSEDGSESIDSVFEYGWYFLPIDLDDVISCEIEGKGTLIEKNSRHFRIKYLVFFREETLEERCIRESIEDQWSKAPAIKSEFVNSGDASAIPIPRDDPAVNSPSFEMPAIKSEFVNSGDASAIPIPRDDPAVNSPSFEMVKGKNDLYSIESEYYDQSEGAQEMLKGEGEVILSHLSIPFPSPSPMKGAYICVDKDSSSPSLLFTFTDSDGKKIYKKYKFIRPKYDYEWHFLPIDLKNIVLCDIKGKGMWEEKNSRCSKLNSLIFIREEIHAESVGCRETQCLDISVLKPKFVNEGGHSIPIPRNDPTIINPNFEMVKGKDETIYKNINSQVQNILKGKDFVSLSHLSIPFPSPSPMKGAYICVDKDSSSPSLLFTFTDSDDKKTFKKYEFTRPKHEYEWYFLSIDLVNVVLCEIEGKGTWEMKNSRRFRINSLVFIREETEEETSIRKLKEETLEKLWSESQIVKPTYIHDEGGDYIPYPLDDPIIICPSFEMVKGQNETYMEEKSNDLDLDDQNLQAQNMLRKGISVKLSHISIPFPSPNPKMKGAYICVNEYHSSPSLLFTFTDCDGKKTYKKYEFTRPVNYDEWHFLPIDLENVRLCEIQGKGTWEEKKSRCFEINSLFFIREETPYESLVRKSKISSHENLFSEAKIFSPKFVVKSSTSEIHIPRDDICIVKPFLSKIRAKNDMYYKDSDDYDLSLEVQNMMKREVFDYMLIGITHLSIPFISSGLIRGVLVCMNEDYYSSGSFIFTFTLRKQEKIMKVYKFSKTESTLSEREKDTSESSKEDSESESSEDGSESIDSVFEYEWYFLPIDLDDVISCEIEGKGWDDDDNNRSFWIDALVFFREETPEERCIRESIEDQWSKAPVITPEFVNSGDESAIPIPRDDPAVNSPSFEMVKGKNDLYSIESEYYDQSEGAQEMLKGEGEVTLSHLSIPFPSPSPMKGAYICVDKDSSSPSLLFTFTDSDGKKIYKKYEFIRPKYDYEWHFLPIDLENIVLCDIKGKGTWNIKYSQSFTIISLLFIKKYVSTGTIEFINFGDCSCIPIPRDDPIVQNPDFSAIKATDKSKEEGNKGYDQSSNAQQMMKEYVDYSEREYFTDISIPFLSSSPIKGIYICLDAELSASQLTFAFTSSKREKKAKKIDFSKILENSWFFISIDISDVILCEIEGKEGEKFRIMSLAFVRERTSEESYAYKIKEGNCEKQWHEATIVKPNFIKKGDKNSYPIFPYDPTVIRPPLDMVQGYDDCCIMESKWYDKSSRAQGMLNGKYSVFLSHLSIPFSQPSPIKGAYICVEKDDSSPSLLFTFTFSNGKKTSKKYEFIKHKNEYEWYFLPIDLQNVRLCDIKGKGTWEEKNSRNFQIDSLIFIKGEDIPPLSSDSTKLIKHDSFTLTSSETITPQCIIGHGGFGEVLLVEVEGIPIPCVLKKMLREADERVVKGCRKEFKMQLKLFTNPKCFNRIPRPLYILDLLDADMKGVYGFIMEFCAGGSVKDFARSWCDDGEYLKAKDVRDESEKDEEYSDSEYSSDSSKSEHDTTHVDPMTLNPVKVCSLCVGMIECLDDVFRAKKRLIHRDVKPNNFLVRVDPKDGDCTVVLGDLGMVQILDSISSSTSSKSAIQGERKEKTKQKNSRCGTLVYNSYETLSYGTQTQKSDGYSLGMSILALFLCEQPFVSLPIFREVYRKVRLGKANVLDIMKLLKRLMENDMCPPLSQSPLFKSLLTIEDRKYELVHKVLNEVFIGLTKLNEDERMSVHEARKRVQNVKDLLPKIGEGFEFPTMNEIIKEKIKTLGKSKNVVEFEYEEESDGVVKDSNDSTSTRQTIREETRDLQISYTPDKDTDESSLLIVRHDESVDDYSLQLLSKANSKQSNPSRSLVKDSNDSTSTRQTIREETRDLQISYTPDKDTDESSLLIVRHDESVDDYSLQLLSKANSKQSNPSRSRVITSESSYIVPPTSELDSLSISSTIQSSIEYRDSRGFDKKKEE